nr:hypothetical protein [Tanacetum cinerariifolium]
MIIETHNWLSSAHQELHKIVRDKIFPIINQVDDRVQNFEIQFLKEAAKFVGDFKSIAKEANESLAKHKALELEIKRLLKAVFSQDIISVMQNKSVVDTSILQTELERMKERLENCIIQKKNEYAKLWNDWINPFKTSREEKHVPNTVSASARTKLITVSQPAVITKKDVNSDLNGLSSTGVDNTKTRRPPPRSNTKHDRDVISKDFCAMYKKCLISVNHDECFHNYVNGKNSRGKKQKAKVSFKENQMKYQPKVTKTKKVGTRESLATPKPTKTRLLLRWLPTGRLFDKEGKIVNSSDLSVNLAALMVIQICLWCVDSGCSKHMTGNLKLLINFIWKFIGTVRFGNDHVVAILVFGQFCDSDLEAAFRRNACFVRNLEGVDLLKGDRSTKLYTINLHEMASASPICLMARASSTNSWLWHQRLSHLNFDTINDIARNDFVSGLPKIYNQRTKKIMETMNVSFDELSVMAFEQRSSKPRLQSITSGQISLGLDLTYAPSKPGLQCMTSGQISSGLDLTYAPSTITTQQPTEGELDLLFEAMYDDYFCGQPSANVENVPTAQEPQVHQTSTASTTIADNVPIPTNSSSYETNIPITSQDVDELNPNAMVDGNTDQDGLADYLSASLSILVSIIWKEA